MGIYSIKELERLSGIKAHTLRIWEKRHNIITPSRTDTNIRYYDDDDLKKIINISILKKSGLKIGTIANYSDYQIVEKIEELHKLKSSPQFYQEQLLIAMIDLDEHKFEKLINNLILKHGFDEAISNIIFPFLNKVGLMWLTSNISPAHEHFLSNLIRQKIIVAIDSLPLPDKADAPKVVLFLPENELHELGLLFYNYQLRKGGYRTLYLGQLVPLRDIKNIVHAYKPEALVTAMSVEPETMSTVEIIAQLSTDIPNGTCCITGYTLRNYRSKIPSNVKFFASYNELSEILPPLAK